MRFLFVSGVALNVLVLSLPVQEREDSLEARISGAEKAAWLTGAGISATLGYAIAKDAHRKMIASFFMRTNADDEDSVTPRVLEEARHHLSNGMQTIELSGNPATVTQSDLDKALSKAIAVPLPEITDDEKDFLLTTAAFEDDGDKDDGELEDAEEHAKDAEENTEDVDDEWFEAEENVGIDEDVD